MKTAISLIKDLDSSCPFSWSNHRIWGQWPPKCSRCYDREAKIAFSKCCNRSGKRRRENAKMLLSAKWPCRGAMWIFWARFLGWTLEGESWEVNLWIFQGASFAGKKQSQKIRPKNSGPKFGRPKFVSQNSALNSGSGRANPLCRLFSLSHCRLGQTDKPSYLRRLGFQGCKITLQHVFSGHLTDKNSTLHRKGAFVLDDWKAPNQKGTNKIDR